MYVKKGLPLPLQGSGYHLPYQGSGYLELNYKVKIVLEYLLLILNMYVS
jgi:hypothetical protein